MVSFFEPPFAVHITSPSIHVHTAINFSSLGIQYMHTVNDNIFTPHFVIFKYFSYNNHTHGSELLHSADFVVDEQLVSFFEPPFAVHITSPSIHVHAAMNFSSLGIQYMHSVLSLAHTVCAHSPLLFWHAPLGVCSAKCTHQSPELTILSQISCFIQREVVGFQDSLCHSGQCHNSEKLRPPIAENRPCVTL